MTGIQQKLATGRGKFTTEYPELGTGPVNYEDSISRGVLRGRAQGRVRAELAVRRTRWNGCRARAPTSPASCPGGWRRSSSPAASTTTSTRSTTSAPTAATRWCGRSTRRRSPRAAAGAFACKYHGWRYGLDGVVNHITNEEEFFDLDKSKLRMPPVHCEVWAGFIFVNLVGGSGAAADVPRRGTARAWRPTRST